MQNLHMQIKKATFLLILFTSLLSVTTQANLRPVGSIALGIDNIHLSTNQNITLITPFQNNYVGNNHDTSSVGGVFLGFETALTSNLSGQIGFSYYINNQLQAKGTVNQFASPAFENLNYQYKIQSQRFFVETKLLSTFKQKYHPYLNAGIGEAVNKAYGYNENPITSDAVPLIPGYGHHTTYSFAYLIGLGIEMDLTANVRLGGMYRFVNLGQARLSTSPLQSSSDTLDNSQLHVNEYLLQLSYLA